MWISGLEFTINSQLGRPRSSLVWVCTFCLSLFDKQLVLNSLKYLPYFFIIPTLHHLSVCLQYEWLEINDYTSKIRKKYIQNYSPFILSKSPQDLFFHCELQTFEPRHGISNNLVCATSKGSDQTAHTRSLIRAFAHHLNILQLLSY